MTSKRPHRDERYRDRCFPGAEEEVFSPKGGGYAPLPYISRELLRHLRPADLKVWLYLLTRGGRYSICYPTYEDIMRGTGLDSKGTVSKAINRLEKIGLVRVHNDRGTRRYLLRDPRLAVEHLFQHGEINDEEIEDVNDLLESIGQPLIERRAIIVPIPTKKTGSSPS